MNTAEGVRVPTPTSADEFAASSAMGRQRVRQAMQQSSRRRGGAGGQGRGSNFSHQEVTTLLNLIERTLPITSRDWQGIATALCSIFPNNRRTDEGCRRKFLALCNKRYMKKKPLFNIAVKCLLLT